MVDALSVVLIMAAQAAASPQSPAAGTPTPHANTAPAQPQSCPAPAADSRAIVICTQRPQGYRLNPDVMEAKREIHSGGRPTRPGGKIVPDCATVGPAPCMIGGVNLIGAALTAVEMAKRAAEGKEIGSMFVTDPHPTEYQLYLMAKARREEEDALNAAAAKAKTAGEVDKDSRPAGN